MNVVVSIHGYTGKSVRCQCCGLQSYIIFSRNGKRNSYFFLSLKKRHISCVSFLYIHKKD